MSLILGLNLPRKLYLVCDTRLTKRCPGKPEQYEDNFIKVFSLSKAVGAVAAGDAHAAANILNKIRSGLQGISINDCRKVIEEKLEEIVKEYVAETGRDHFDVALIVGGYDVSKKKLVSSTRFGETMATNIQKAGGIINHYKIDGKILQALLKKMMQMGIVQHQILEVDDLPYSTIFSIEIHASRTGLTIPFKEIECYDAVVNHPNQQLEQITLPNELIAKLEIDHQSTATGEDVLYEDAERIMTFVQKARRERNFSTVGGHVLPFFQTPEGMAFTTGDIATIRDGKPVKVGSVTRAVDGELWYEGESGERAKYRWLEDVLKTEDRKEFTSLAI